MAHKAIALVLLLFLAVVAAADVKYTIEMQTAPGMPGISSTVYVKGQMERRDTTMPGMGTQISTITQCGKKQTITLNAKCNAYFSSGLESEAGAAPAGRAEAGGPARQGGVVTVENDIRDTGERQTMFGQQARHLILKMKMNAGPGSCHPGSFEMENDMWVISVPGAHAECGAKFGEPPPVSTREGCRDKYQVTNRGATAAIGLPVKQTMTMIAEGQRNSMTMEVKDLSTATLDASLFEVPAGAKQVNSAQEVYTCGMGMGGMQAQMAEAMKRAREQSEAQPQQRGPGAAAKGREGGPIGDLGTVGGASAAGGQAGKRAGVALIGVVSTDKSGKVQPDTMTRQIVQAIGNVGGFEGVAIDAREPAEIQKEASAKKCDFLLYDNVAEAKTGMPKIGGLLGRAAGRGGSVESTQNIRTEYRLTLVEPFDQQVARDTMNQSEQGTSMDPVLNNLATKLAERATTDARRWKQQNK